MAIAVALYRQRIDCGPGEGNTKFKKMKIQYAILFNDSIFKSVKLLIIFFFFLFVANKQRGVGGGETFAMGTGAFNYGIFQIL